MQIQVVVINIKSKNTVRTSLRGLLDVNGVYLHLKRTVLIIECSFLSFSELFRMQIVIWTFTISPNLIVSSSEQRPGINLCQQLQCLYYWISLINMKPGVCKCYILQDFSLCKINIKQKGKVHTFISFVESNKELIKILTQSLHNYFTCMTLNLKP